MNTTDAGRLGESKVISRLTELGWYPFVDISGKCPVDIFAWKDGRTIRIQVKTTATKSPAGNFVVQIGSVRPNRSGNVVKKFDPTSMDYLAICVIPDGHVYLIPSSDITTGRTLTVTTDHAKFLDL